MATPLTTQFETTPSTSHAILLVGVHGHSASYEAQLLAKKVVGSNGVLHNLQKADDKTGINIQQIRDLYIATRTKSAGQKRVWVIQDADTMSLDAQNAFLKLLEEPPENVTFILCAAEAMSLLPTIHSRTQLIQCRPFIKEHAQTYMKGQVPPEQTAQLLFLADGSASELLKLVEDDSYREKQLERAQIAKQLLSASVFEKVILIHAMASDREHTLAILRLVLKIFNALSPRQAEQKAALTQMNRFLEAYERIQQNGNIKVQLLRAVT